MALIAKKEQSTQQNISIEIESKLHQDILSYCKWAGFENDLSYFVQEAAQFVLSKDKDWKAHKKSKSTTEAV